jgi:hypothetical protein
MRSQFYVKCEACNVRFTYDSIAQDSVVRNGYAIEEDMFVSKKKDFYDFLDDGNEYLC